MPKQNSWNKAAALKRAQLEKEIHDSMATPQEKTNMLHSLSKLWIFVTEGGLVP